MRGDRSPHLVLLLSAVVYGAPVGNPRHAANARPNIVYFLTDDQDMLLGGSFPEIGGVGPMFQTKRLLSEKGTTAENFYVHTPICNPSRGGLLSGRYFHNIKAVGGHPASFSLTLPSSTLARPRSSTATASDRAFAAAERALDTMNYTMIKGRPIRIMWSHRGENSRP